MASNKKTAKSLKKPDALQRFGVTMSDWIFNNQKSLILAGIAIGAIAIGAWGAVEYQESARLKRIERVAVAELIQFSEQKSFSDSQDTIQKMIRDLKERLNPIDKKKKIAKKEKAKIEKQISSLEKQTETAEPDFKKSTAEFIAVFKELQVHAEGWYAGLKGAKGLIDQKDYKNAQSLVEKVASASKDHMIYGSQSRIMLFGLYQQNGEFDKASSLSNKIISSASEDDKPEWLLAKAKLLITLKKNEEAKKLLNNLVTEHSDARQAKIAQNIMSVLL